MVLLLAPASSCVIEPEAATALPVLAPKAVFSLSEKPSLAAVLVTFSACSAAPPTRRLPKLIGEGVASPVAKRKKLAETLTT